MALSKKRTVMAVLRGHTNLKAEPFAELVGRKPDWLKKVECGKLPLLPAMARAVAHATGAGLGWLLRGDASAPPVDWRGRPYTLATWNEYRAKFARGNPDLLVGINAEAWLPEVAAIADAAADKYQLALFAQEMDAALKKLRKRFGWNRATGEAVLDLVAQEQSSFHRVLIHERAAAGGRDGIDAAPLMRALPGGLVKIFQVAVPDAEQSLLAKARAEGAPVAVEHAVEELPDGGRRETWRAVPAPARQARRKAGKTGKKPAKARKKGV